MTTYTTWNLILNRELWAQVTFSDRFDKAHVEACSRQKYNLPKLAAEKA